jgi:hypothetical protein
LFTLSQIIGYSSRTNVVESISKDSSSMHEDKLLNQWLIMKREFADWLITQKEMVERCKEVGIQSPERLFSKKNKRRQKRLIIHADS